MRFFTCFIFIFVTTISISGQAPFVTTWQTDYTGIGCTTCVRLPINSYYSDDTTVVLNYDVDWENDGVYDEFDLSTEQIVHDYGIPGTYQIAIRGSIPKIAFEENGDNDKIMSIDQWGEVEWWSLDKAFRGCTNLVSNATDSPNLSKVKDLSRMFANATSFNGDLSQWNVSKLMNAYFMFYNATSFNSDLNQWDVSEVTIMGYMFSNAITFNSDLNLWDVSSVSDMGGMFFNASSFNGDVSTWDVRNVTYARSMFFFATNFNSDISEWKLSKNQNFINMLDNTSLDQSNYDKILIEWSMEELNNDMTFGTEGLEFCDGAAARDSLIINKGWIFDGDINVCEPVLVEDQEFNNITIFPNPSDGLISITSKDGIVPNRYTLYSSNGVLLMDGKMLSSDLDLSSLPPNIYFLKFSSVDGIYVRKIVLNKL